MPIDDHVTELRAALAAPLAHPSVAELQGAAAAITAWTFHHSATLSQQPIGSTESPAFLRAALGRPPREEGLPVDQLIAEFEQWISPYTFRTNHPRFLAFVPGAPCLPSVLGDWLTAALNAFAGVWLEASGPAQVETTVLEWFRTWLGMPASTLGVLTTGGSEANLIALVTARERIPQADRGRIVAYVGMQRHWSIDRAAKVMGLRPDQIRPLAVDEQFRLRGQALRQAIDRDRQEGWLPWLVVANAGATNTGTVDALEELSAVCTEEKIWLHVDAAYGWAACLTAKGRAELSGISLADSITLDPHKWLAQTFDVGCVLVRDGARLPETFALRPDYMQDVEPRADEINYCDHGIALTRRFRALKIWLSVHMLGLGWFRNLVEHCCRLADYAEACLTATGQFEILCPRHLSIVCFRYVPRAMTCNLDSLNSRLVDALRATGRAFLSSTRLNGQFAIRLCFVNWRTTSGDVDEIVELLCRLGTELQKSPVVPDFPAVAAVEAVGKQPPT